MTRTMNSPGAHALRERICEAAIDLFAAKGYHGTSMRDLAGAVGVEAASLYYHFPSKQDILLALFEGIMNEQQRMLQAALLAARRPSEGLRAVTRSHVLYHIMQSKEAFVSHSELRSLTPANRRQIVTSRDRYEDEIRSLLKAGVVCGEFDIDDVPVAATALLCMWSGVSDWIQPRGRLDADEIADIYSAMALRIVGAREVAAPAAAQAAQH